MSTRRSNKTSSTKPTRVVLGPDLEELTVLRKLYQQMRAKWHTESDTQGSEEDIYDAYTVVRQFYNGKGRKH